MSAASSRALLRHAAVTGAAIALAALTTATPAGAIILPAVTVAGPSQEIVGFGGAAMAEDGTGGVVFLKREGGVPHVFVSRFVNGQWQAPIRVDSEEPYAASWPRIGAADGGELIVTWATQYALTPPPEEKPVYEMLGAVLGPGSERFGRAILIDKDIHEATGTDPELAVSSTGQADLVYRVVEQSRSGVVALRPGDVTESVRVAHFDGTRWTGLGAVNRNTGVAMRPPTEANAPRIAVGPTGNGIVVWQEPELDGVARLWARRIFGTSLDYVMPVSATTYKGAPITDDAEAPALAFSRLGQAEVAYRQPAGASSPLPGPRIFLNILPDGESVSGAEFEGASVLDEDVAGGKAATVGAPSIDIDERRYMRVVYDDDGQPRLIEASDRGLTGALTLGPPFSGPETAAVSVMNPEGGGIAAWPSTNEGHAAVAVLENFPDGAVQTGLVAGGAGGEVSELSVGRSGLGDGIVAFRQGSLGDAAIVAATVSAPPSLVPFVLTLPNGWVRPGQAVATWTPAPSGDGPISYQLVVDGHEQGAPIPESAVNEGVLRAHVDTRGLSTGVHQVQVLATDRYGESTLTAPGGLQLADSPPRVLISRTRHGTAVSVKVKDPAGLDKSALSIDFGDGSSTHGKASSSHAYRRAGVYLVTVRASDSLGNAGVIKRWVNVR
ncbi:MAG TPA: PKD domain-containing protein [Solirubrobacteraceae bacterium]|nr:PKD domain-containing protein [Solirubrobacteraceae bacterium]